MASGPESLSFPIGFFIRVNTPIGSKLFQRLDVLGQRPYRWPMLEHHGASLWTRLRDRRRNNERRLAESALQDGDDARAELLDEVAEPPNISGRGDIPGRTGMSTLVANLHEARQPQYKVVLSSVHRHGKGRQGLLDIKSLEEPPDLIRSRIRLSISEGLPDDLVWNLSVPNRGQSSCDVLTPCRASADSQTSPVVRFRANRQHLPNSG